jgi:Kef-type K+ transport system membrane component KefB
MNTRGLMELIVLNVGLDLGILSPELFAMLVIMALVTTFATTPILHALRLDERDLTVPDGEPLRT